MECTSQKQAALNETFDKKPAAESQEYLELERKLNNQIVLNQRYMSEFEKRSKEIFRTFRHLIGFKINFQDNTVKLTSILNNDHFLLFRV